MFGTILSLVNLIFFPFLSCYMISWHIVVYQLWWAQTTFFSVEDSWQYSFLSLLPLGPSSYKNVGIWFRPVTRNNTTSYQRPSPSANCEQKRKELAFDAVTWWRLPRVSIFCGKASLISVALSSLADSVPWNSGWLWRLRFTSLSAEEAQRGFFVLWMKPLRRRESVYRILRLFPLTELKIAWTPSINTRLYNLKWTFPMGNVFALKSHFNVRPGRSFRFESKNWTENEQTQIALLGLPAVNVTKRTVLNLERSS